MKTSITDRLKELLTLLRRYLKLQTDCIRLEAAEKTTLLISWLAIGLIGILTGALIVVLLTMSAVCAFGEVLPPWLAYLCVAVILALLAALCYAFRKTLIVDPISRMITKLFCPSDPKSDKP